MKIKLLTLIILTSLSISANSQNFGTWSGTIRLGGGLYGTQLSYATPVTAGLLRAFKFTNWTNKDFQNWSSEQHGIFRFFNIGGDILVPDWTISSLNAIVELRRDDDDNFLNDPVNQYTYYIGYYFNWRSAFSRFGFFFGADYEWKNFVILYPKPNSYHVYSHIFHNKIHSIVPTFGLRYRLISPMKEIEGFPFNIVLEGGLSYVVNIKYDNYDGYDLAALNNGFRPILGIAITTNRFGSIHLRWTKDLYDLFNNEYTPTNGPLYNNVIYNEFSRMSIGWSIFI